MRSPLAGRPPVRATSGAHRADTDSTRIEKSHHEGSAPETRRAQNHQAPSRRAGAGEMRAIEAPPRTETRGTHRRSSSRRRRWLLSLGVGVSVAATALAAHAAFGFSVGNDNAVRAGCEVDGSTCSGSASAEPSASPEAPRRHVRRSAPPPAAGRATPSASPKRVAAAGTVFSPYVNPLSFDMAAAIRTAGIKHFNLAFILSGGGCTATWDGVTALSDATATSHISAFRAAGGSVRVSFGGESGTELAAACDSAESLAAAYQSVIDAYSITKLDFDIEGSELADADANDRRAKAIAILERTASAAGKSLSISFTLPVGPTGLTAASVSLLNNAASNGIGVDIVNIMAMDYGDDAAPNPDGQMGSYAIQAMKATQGQLKSIFGLSDGAAWRRVAVTPLIGVNEPATEVFTVSDAAQVGNYARSKGAAFVSMWQIARDKPCSDGAEANATSDSCAGGSSSTYAFTNAFLG